MSNLQISVDEDDDNFIRSTNESKQNNLQQLNENLLEQTPDTQVALVEEGKGLQNMSPQKSRVSSCRGSNAFNYTSDPGSVKQVPHSARANAIQPDSDNDNYENYASGQINTEPEEHPFRKLDPDLKEMHHSNESANSSTANWLHGTPRNQDAVKGGSHDMQNNSKSINTSGDPGQRFSCTQSNHDSVRQGLNSARSSLRESRKNFTTSNENPRLQMDTYDSELDDRRDQKLVFKYIQRQDFKGLETLLGAKKSTVDVMTIHDKQGYTPIHYAAYKNMEKAVEILISFVQNDTNEDSVVLSSSGPHGGSGDTGDKNAFIKKLKQRQQAKQQECEAWINSHSRGEDGFTALHFAAFHGNMSLIKLLVKHGADIYAQNKQGINMLHVAAQGDQPVSLAYFLRRGLNINSTDKRLSTPLHWAAFSGAELTLSYIIAWGGELNAVDTKGLTPLHLACKSHKEIRSNKGIKQLLIKGANRNAMDYQTMRPLDYVPLPPPESYHRPEPIVIEIRRLLQEEWSFFGDCLMIRTTFRKQEKKPMTLIAYFVLMISTFVLQHYSSHKLVRFAGTHGALLMTSQILFGLSLFFCTLVWLSDPGFIKKDKSLDFVELLDTLEASSLCPDCEVIRTPRCRHCTLCKRCVDRFDHHCPWVNNCIGKGNFAYFYAFVVTQSLYLLSVVIISGYYIYLEWGIDVYADQEDREMHPWHKYRRGCGILITFISVIFLTSVLILCWYQTGNLIKGETTCERFSNTNYKHLHALQQEAMSLELSMEVMVKRRMSVLSINDMTNQGNATCGNITGMCCDSQIMTQREILAKTHDEYGQVMKQLSIQNGSQDPSQSSFSFVPKKGFP